MSDTYNENPTKRPGCRLGGTVGSKRSYSLLINNHRGFIKKTPFKTIGKERIIQPITIFLTIF